MTSGRRLLVSALVAVPILALGIGLLGLGVAEWIVRPIVVVLVVAILFPLTMRR
jgi:hypothetical protein